MKKIRIPIGIFWCSNTPFWSKIEHCDLVFKWRKLRIFCCIGESIFCQHLFKINTRRIKNVSLFLPGANKIMQNLKKRLGGLFFQNIFCLLSLKNLCMNLFGLHSNVCFDGHFIYIPREGVGRWHLMWPYRRTFQLHISCYLSWDTMLNTLCFALHIIYN